MLKLLFLVFAGIATAMLFVALSGCTTVSYAVKDGQGPALIALPDSPTREEEFAAAELQEFLQKSTGCQFRIVSHERVGKDEPVIQLGKRPQLPDLPSGKYMIKADNNQIYLYGASRRGTLSAVYRFLEDHAGIRFLNAYGENHVPQLRTICLEDGEKVYSELNDLYTEDVEYVSEYWEWKVIGAAGPDPDSLYVVTRQGWEDTYGLVCLDTDGWTVRFQLSDIYAWDNAYRKIYTAKTVPFEQYHILTYHVYTLDELTAWAGEEVK